MAGIANADAVGVVGASSTLGTCISMAVMGGVLLGTPGSAEDKEAGGNTEMPVPVSGDNGGAASKHNVAPNSSHAVSVGEDCGAGCGTGGGASGGAGGRGGVAGGGGGGSTDREDGTCALFSEISGFVLGGAGSVLTSSHI
mmetsp:Transcript_108418/g.231516  ORF Transcript_108418/g.231516 Transcript_108418/m.231516 type:complete len:141 (+) Transcript_108418:159-581(+)